MRRRPAQRIALIAFEYEQKGDRSARADEQHHHCADRLSDLLYAHHSDVLEIICEKSNSERGI
jgi:hypothetical protein